MQKRLLILGGAFVLAVLSAGVPGGQDKAEAQQKTEAQQKAEAQQMDTTPLSCNLTAMTPRQRQHYSEIKTRLRSAIQETEELPNGYAFRCNADPSVLMAAAEFITLESRCCPFFSFVLEVKHNGGPMWLRITGPKAAMPFIKEALTC